VCGAVEHSAHSPIACCSASSAEFLAGIFRQRVYLGTMLSPPVPLGNISPLTRTSSHRPRRATNLAALDWPTSISTGPPHPGWASSASTTPADAMRAMATSPPRAACRTGRQASYRFDVLVLLETLSCLDRSACMRLRPFSYIRDKMIPIAYPIREPKSLLERTPKCHVLPALK
jgi:hypothetical protein